VVPEVTPTPVFDPAKCIPFARTGGGGLTWEQGAFTLPAGSAALRTAPAAGGAVLGSAHGKWCGAGRGGFHDCCAGAACKECSAAEGATAACLAACPPADDVDAACAAHDACAAKTDSVETHCGPGGASLVQHVHAPATQR
jgi:hypothetical protein